MAEKWVGKIGLKKGQLHRDLGIAQGKPISTSTLEEIIARNPGGKIAARARLALRFRRGLGKKGVAKAPESSKKKD